MISNVNIPLITTFVILAASIGLFLSDRLRADLVALLIVVALGVTNVLTPQETFSGFSRSAVITIMAIFILAEGLQRTGVTERFGELILRVGGTQERRLVIVVMLTGAFLSLFMNNIAAASVLLPAVSVAARKARVNPARLLMPLAFATILGGMATLLTTTNIIVSSLLRDQKLGGFGLLEFAPLGLPIVIVGIAYMVLWGRHLLPVRSPADELAAPQPDRDLVEVYQLGQRLFRARVSAGSHLIGRPLEQSGLRETFGVNVVAIEGNGQAALSPAPDAVFSEGDVVLCEGKLEELHRWNGAAPLELLPPAEWREHDLESATVVVVEAVLSPRSRLIGQTLRGAHFRVKFGMTVLAIWREGRQIRSGLTDMSLRFGDALLLQGPRSRLQVLRDEKDLIVLANGKEKVKLVPGKARLALAITGLTLLLAGVNSAAVAELMLAGALAMVLTGVLSMDQAYRAIEWKTVFLVAGMLPMGIAMTKTGAAALLANGLVAFLGPAGPLVLLAGLFILTTLLTQTMHGAAVATVIAPVAIQTAQYLGVDPRAMAMGVALATSMAFLTPLGHPVNVLVMSSGGYRFVDYFKVGLPLTLLLFALIMLLLPIFWPLG